LFEVRLVLEIAAARIGATRMTEDRLDRLGQLTADAQRVLGQPLRYLQYDLQIHSAIIEATGNPIYVRLYNSIADLSSESPKRTTRSPATRQREHEDHVAIVAALRAKDPGAAADAMEKHLTGMRGAFGAVAAPTRVVPSGRQREDRHRRQDKYRRQEV
jgi:GntR family transcriptional regulator, transcriptional repressor for pyruvate dehydrogenase complex